MYKAKRERIQKGWTGRGFFLRQLVIKRKRGKEGGRFFISLLGNLRTSKIVKTNSLSWPTRREKKKNQKSGRKKEVKNEAKKGNGTIPKVGGGG